MVDTEQVRGRRNPSAWRTMLMSLALLAPIVASCVSLDDPNQVVIRRDENPYDFAAAHREADQICAARGRRARFVIWENNAGGSTRNAGLPDAIYDCIAGG